MKYLFTACVLIVLAACSTQDEQYYRIHPQALQTAIKDCPQKQPPHSSCEKLAGIAREVNELVLQLQSNPQDFGRKILSLQEKLAKQQTGSPAGSSGQNSAISIENEQLAARLAVVKWLESPES